MLQIIYISITLVYALVVTKVKLAKIQRIMSCVPQHWPYCRNFHLSQTGRILIAWDTNIWHYLVISTSLQQITLKVRNQGGLEGSFTIVYGENTQGRRMALWKDLMISRTQTYLG